jgi:hypothetical protein
MEAVDIFCGRLVYFILIWYIFGLLINFVVIWYIFGLLINFVVIWYICSHFGMLCEEKSGNPDL